MLEMARQREEAMWAVLDWAATQPGEFTIRDMYRIWAQAGGGGDSASYQQFSTSIQNYVYKYDPHSPKEKYRNPRYKYIRVGKTDKGTVPAPLQTVTRGARGAGNAEVLRWRPGIAPMRQPAPPKTPLHADADPVGDALDRLEKRLGRPGLKAVLARWRSLGNLHRISADIMADSQIRGKDKMLALQVAADALMRSGQATQSQVSRAEDEMDDRMGATAQGTRTPFSPNANDFADEPTQPDAQPLGAGQGEEPQDPDVDVPDDILHGDGDVPPESSGEETPTDDDGPMAGHLINDDGKRVRVTVEYDEDEGATVVDGSGQSYGPYEGYDLEVANGVLTQEAFDDLEEDGWNLVAAEGDTSVEPDVPTDAQDAGAADSGGNDEDEDDGEDAGEPDDVGNTAEGEYPAYVPEPDEEGDKYNRAMFVLVDEGDLREDNPLWGQLRAARDSTEAHQVIIRSGLPKGLHRYALTVARAIFTNTGRDFDTGRSTGNESGSSRLAGLFGLNELLTDPVDFEQIDGLARLYRDRRNSR